MIPPMIDNVMLHYSDMAAYLSQRGVARAPSLSISISATDVETAFARMKEAVTRADAGEHLSDEAKEAAKARAAEAEREPPPKDPAFDPDMITRILGTGGSA